MRRLFTLLVVASWVAMMSLLVRKHTAPAASSSTALPAGTVGEREEWFAVRHEKRTVGHAHRTTARSPDGPVFSEDLTVALTMFGVSQTLRTSLVAETDDAFALRRFRFSLVSPTAVFSATGTSDGRRLRIAYGPDGRRSTLELPLAEPIYLASTVRPRVFAGDRAPGTRYTVSVFNPLSFRHEPLTVVVEGRETLDAGGGRVETTRLVEEHQGMRARVWIADDGTVVREEGTLGFTLEREPREAALAGIAALAPVDLTAASRIPFAGRIDDPRNADRLTLRVRGDAAVPDDPPRQRRAGDRLTIVREAVPARFPLPPADPLTPELTAHLDPSPFIEADDPAIVEVARSVVGDRQDGVAAARRLVDWVHEHVAQVPRPSVPSAREVLGARRGDCNEQAVLLAALARASGIPARVVAGAMYVDGGFAYHAWTELWLGAWVSADPIVRQLGTDATHVKLLEGGPDRHLALAGVLGRLAFAATEEVP